MITHLKTWRREASYLAVCLAILSMTGISFMASPSLGQSPLRPNLGTAASYAVFTGGGAINNTGLTKLTGDVGQDGAYAFNGFPPGTYTGTLNRNNSASALAKSDLLTAWTTEAAVTCGYVLGVGIVDGQSFDPAVYCSGAATTTDGNITFNAHGDPSAIFIVKIGGALTVHANTHILLSNGAQSGNIYWFVDGAINVADNSSMKGTLYARGAITFSGTSSLDGRALAAPLGAITLSANNMTLPGNNLSVVKPALGDTLRSGTQNSQITWSGTGIDSLKYFDYSLDNGLTWKRIGQATTGGFSYSWTVPDTFSTRAVVRVSDKNGLTANSGAFTISKISVIRPATAEIVRAGTMNYQITWTGAGIDSQKTFEYSLDSGATWTRIGQITSTALTYGWNVPDTSSTKAIVRITDRNGLTGKSGAFTIGKLTVLKPMAGDTIKAGTQNYQIKWSGAGINSRKTFDYSLDGGITWTLIGVMNADAFSYGWNVPDTFSSKAVVRITDNLGLTSKSGLFTISKIVVVRPSAGDVLVGGTQNYAIVWTGAGIASPKILDYSLDGGSTWTPFGYLPTDAMTFNWNVPDTNVTGALIRITDKNGLVGVSGLFSITSVRVIPGTITVLTPVAGESVTAKTQNYPITWTGSRIASNKIFEYSLDGGMTWTYIGAMNADAFSYSWNVPDTTSNRAMIRITDANGAVGLSGLFTINRVGPNPGTIDVEHPAPGEVINGGTANFNINWEGSNIASQKTFEYSLDGGANWVLIGTMNTDQFNYNWAMVPNVSTTRGLVRITDANGSTGTSGMFTIVKIVTPGSINSLTLSNLDSKNNIGNNRQLGISWTFTPDIGTSMEVEYSLDYTKTWSHIATVQTSENPSTTWMTTPTGYYNPVFIRITSSKGMTRTSEPFSIGNAIVAGVLTSQKNGYSVANYPNPASGETNFSFVLPVASDVTMTITDVLGHEVANIASEHFDAGTHNIMFNSAALIDGTYSYVLHAGSTILTGRLVVVK